MPGSILIASNIEFTREAIKQALSFNYPLLVVESGEQVILALQQKAPIQLIYLGTSLKDNDDDIFAHARKLAGKTMIIAIGESQEERPATDAVKEGATGYIMSNAPKSAIRSFAQKAFA